MEAPNLPTLPVGPRRNEDIALDLMKFIVTQTESSKGIGVGFQQAGHVKGQEYADKLLDLYRRCLSAVEGKRA